MSPSQRGRWRGEGLSSALESTLLEWTDPLIIASAVGMGVRGRSLPHPHRLHGELFLDLKPGLIHYSPRITNEQRNSFDTTL